MLKTKLYSYNVHDWYTANGKHNLDQIVELYREKNNRFFFTWYPMSNVLEHYQKKYEMAKSIGAM